VTAADSERRCVKCGNADIYIEWHAAGPEHPTRYYAECRPYGSFRGKPVQEHLCCRCRVCGYRWTEDTVDHEEWR
jgi:hypothetical protein